MRIHSHLDADYLKSLGFTRAVLARELPLEDIRAFADTGLETEIFVHGAICVSESGGCLMSSVIGNRSGNRGECAQPCRLPYKGENRFPLSDSSNGNVKAEKIKKRVIDKKRAEKELKEFCDYANINYNKLMIKAKIYSKRWW